MSTKSTIWLKGRHHVYEDMQDGTIFLRDDAGTVEFTREEFAELSFRFLRDHFDLQSEHGREFVAWVRKVAL